MASAQKSKKQSVGKQTGSAAALGNRPTKTASAARSSSSEQGRPASGSGLLPLVRHEWRTMAIVLGVTCLAYLNALDGEFVYDDRFQVLRNQMIRSLDNLPEMFAQSVWQFMNLASEEAVGLYYRPLFNVVLAINYNLFGTESTFGWHFVSLLIHLLVTLMVYVLARQWGLARQAAFAAALLFGVHPTHSESVAWISGLPDPLAALFILPAVLFHERYYHGGKSHWHQLGLSLLFALLAMLSKEVAIVLPVFLAVREWLDKAAGESSVAAVTRALKRAAPVLAVTIIYLLARYAVLGFISKPEPKAIGISNAHVLLTIPSILLAYARLLLVPYPLAVIYDHSYVTSATDPRFWGAALGVLALLAGAIWLLRASPIGLRSLALLVLFLLPVLNLKTFNPQESLLHDRYLYVPSIGFCLLMALALGRLNEYLSVRRKQATIMPTVVTASVLFLLTVYQNGFWQNGFVMANRALQWAPQRPFLHNYLGAHYQEQNQLAEAEQAYRRAVQYDPNYYDAHSNLANIYRQQGKYAEAIEHYQKAIKAGAIHVDTYYNLGVTYTELNRLAEAEAPLRRAIEIAPMKAEAWYNLAWVYDHQGKLEQAAATYAEALRVRPSYPEPRINLGILLTKQGKYAEALEQLRIAQQYAPGHPVLLYALGDVYLKTNRHQEAINALTQLVRMQPQHRLAYTNLGLCYEALGQIEQAKAAFQKAVELAPEDAHTRVARERLAKLP
ncbi:MAG: tetratricopeptide repeat protein [Acidobacteriota bacterium]|nr:tetratricopeptide repeat protein [Blastocatellia bacterium]MDW8240331.1 tetratricopeptide repeat protein [Acidobacteriota bacterium]